MSPSGEPGPGAGSSGPGGSGADASAGDDEAFREVRDDALHLLSYRGRTESEMRRRLRRKGHDEERVEAVVGWLLDRGYLDDRAFARDFVAERLRRRPRGPFALVQELRKRGVDRGLAEAVVERVMEEEGVDERAVARSAAGRWLRKQSESVREALGRQDRSDDGRSARRRLYAHLERKGFSRDAVRETVERVREELRSGGARGSPP